MYSWYLCFTSASDSNGNVYRQYVYDPYGNIISIKDGSGTAVDISITRESIMLTRERACTKNLMCVRFLVQEEKSPTLVGMPIVSVGYWGEKIKGFLPKRKKAVWFGKQP
ncbi:RHS repeat protein [Desulfosporosinus hippei]|uniref:RHS repeat protein n=1 Tax=Desulfosporosinus hippei TaxID=569859 RepID=UPI000B86B04A|nr:RHS repeat protein [Desulfosporosinus hippei]